MIGLRARLFTLSALLVSIVLLVTLFVPDGVWPSAEARRLDQQGADTGDPRSLEDRDRDRALALFTLARVPTGTTTATLTPTSTRTATLTPTTTQTPTATPTEETKLTATSTSTSTATLTPSSTLTATPTNTRTATPTPTSIPEPPSIDVYTDRSSYSMGQTQRFGLDLENPGPEQPVRFVIFLWTSFGRFPLVDANITLPAGFSYSNSNVFQWRLPMLPPGQYAWVGVLVPLDEDPIFDVAMWTFTSQVSSKGTTDMEKILGGIPRIDLGFVK